MKRLLLGIGLMTVLLVLGIVFSGVLERSNGACAELLYEASDRGIREDWEQAAALSRRAREKWQKNWAVTAALADHQPMDEIDALFAELDACLAARDSSHFGATGAHLASLLEAISQSHQVTVWNLLCPLPGL